MATPLPFTSLVPKFYIRFVQAGATNSLTFYDTVNAGYSAYGTVTNFKGLIKITDPDGIIIRQNNGWSTTAPNFDSPDTNGNTPTWTVSGITLPSTVKEGTYTFEYIASIDPTGDPLRVYFVHITRTFNYYDALPDITIDFTISCRTSEITVTDSTDYDLSISGVSYPASITRTLTLYKPPLAGCNNPGSTSASSMTFGGGGTALTDLWTGNWDATVSTVASYTMATWGTTTPLVYITATLTGADDVDVTCDDCACDLQLCIQNLINDWKDSIGANLKRENELRTKVIKVLAAWTNYEQAERCGDTEDMTSYCEEIKQIVATEDCDCPTSTDAAPVRVIAWGSGGGGSTPSTFVFTISGVNPSGGNSGDVHLNISTWNIWKNNGGTWTDYGSIQGGPGGDGADGENQSILDHDYADHACETAAGVQTLYTYSMPANTVTTAGDSLILTMLFQLASNANGKTLYLTFGGTDLLSYFTDSLVNTSNNTVRLQAWITRTGAATQDIEVYALRNGVPSNKHAITTGVKDFAGIIAITARCETATSTASDITLKEFKAEYQKMIVSP